MNKSAFVSSTSPVVTGLVIMLLLTGCVAADSPEQVTLAFWKALSAGEEGKAKSYATEDSRTLVSSSLPQLVNASFETGRIVIDGDQATVETRLHSATGTDPTAQTETETFETVLSKQHGQWLVDYRQTLDNLNGDLFNGMFKSLQQFGEKLNKKLDQHLPKIERKMQSFSDELEKQLDDLGNKLDKTDPPPKPPATPNTDTI